MMQEYTLALELHCDMYRVDQKNAPLYQKVVGLAYKYKTTFSIKWSIFFGPPCSLVLWHSGNSGVFRTRLLTFSIRTLAHINIL